MATNKKSFLWYVDTISVFEKLTDEEAGRLVKHLLRYVNDLQPEAPDRLTELLFEPFKQYLKRDLKKWQAEVEAKSQMGIIGNLKRWNKDIYEMYLSKEITIERAVELANERKQSLIDSNNRLGDKNIAKAIKNTENIAVSVIDSVSVIVSEDNNKNKSIPPDTVEFFISIEELEEFMLSDYKWIEDIARINKLGSTYEEAISESKKWVRLFVEKLRADNVKEQHRKDCFKYCNNWIKIQLRNAKQDPTKNRNDIESANRKQKYAAEFAAAVAKGN